MDNNQWKSTQKSRDCMGNYELFAHFFSENYSGLIYLIVKIIDKTNIDDPATQGFWTYKLNCFILREIKYSISFKL